MTIIIYASMLGSPRYTLAAQHGLTVVVLVWDIDRKSHKSAWWHTLIIVRKNVQQEAASLYLA